MEQPITPTPEIPFSPPPVSRSPEPYSTGRKEMIFCAAMVLVALSMANFILIGDLNLGFAIAATASIACSFSYLSACGHKGNWYTRSILILCLIIAAGFGYSDDGFVKFVLFLFLFTGVNLALCISAGQNRRDPGTVQSLLDAPRAFFALGFGKMEWSIRGIIAFFRTGGENSRRTGAILAGLAIAVPVLAVMIPLLMGADAAFQGLMDQLPDFDLAEAIITAFWGFWLFVVLYTRSVALHFEGKASPPVPSHKKLHLFTVNTVLCTVCALYLVYLLSQIAYFSGGFLGILPQGYSTAEYARRGFFEMAWLCAINLGIITFGVGLVSGTDGIPRSTRLLCLFLGLVTLFLVCASCAKMVLYIGTYGLTRLRVLTMAIIVFLALTTILVSVWLFLPKLRYMKIIFLIALVMGAGILWMDVDTQVARYNVSAYLSGDLQTVDVRHLGQLGDGALPYLVQLTEAEDPIVAAKAQEVLSVRHARQPDDFRSWNYLTAVGWDLLSGK